jgi:hypothetical protein
MADDMAQRFLMFGPVVQDRPAIQPDHVGQPRDVVIAAERQPDTLKQAEQVEFVSAPISSRTSSVGKSSTRMITPSHRARKLPGRRSKISCAIVSISASEGAFADVHIASL